MHITIIGPTSGIAEQCMRLWLKNEPAYLSLVARSASDLTGLLKDIAVRSPKTKVATHICDFSSPQNISETIATIATTASIDVALVAHGFLPEQQDCQANLDVLAETMWVNGVSAVLFAEALVSVMFERTGSIGIISSVAGERGRRSNYAYGSAKSMVTKFAEGLQHRLSKSPLKISLIKPGPVQTPMTNAIKPEPKFIANAPDVAAQIVDGMASGKQIIYTPRKWQIIMAIIRALPFRVFKNLEI